MSDPNNPCLFCTIKKEDIIEENEFAYATFDSYPVSSQHCLIVPKRHVKDYFELNNDEVTGCDQLIKKIKNQVEKNDKTVKGFNIGINSGKVAGQSIMHCHIHLIPRREGDVENPQGGVRGVIPSKQHYTRKNK
jgi:diadenosine tetraphosphate (Ap4A) HIT family hydrolase